jgi:hypothetical protein
MLVLSSSQFDPERSSSGTAKLRIRFVDAEAIAIVFDLVEPVRAGGDAGGLGRDTELKGL